MRWWDDSKKHARVAIVILQISEKLWTLKHTGEKPTRKRHWNRNRVCSEHFEDMFFHIAKITLTCEGFSRLTQQ